MKFLMTAVLLSSIGISNQINASVDLHQVSIQNNETSDSFGLSSVATRTEYRNEQVSSTCYETVFAGYETICNGYNFGINFSEGDPIRHPAPGREPRDPRDPPPERKTGGEPREPSEPSYPREPRCHQEARYRQVAYSCMKSISTPYEVFDHTALANINVKISAAPMTKPQTQNCGINFALNGDYLSTSNNCQDYLAIAQVSKTGNGYSSNYSYAINLLDAEKVFAPLNGNLSNMHIDGDYLVFRTGNLSNKNNISLKLFVQRERVLAKDVQLINRTLSANEYSYEAIDEKAGNVKINLNNLVGALNDRKYTIQVNFDLALPTGTIISGTTMPSLHQEASIIKKR